MDLKFLFLILCYSYTNVYALKKPLSGDALKNFLKKMPDLWESRELKEEQLNYYKHRRGLAWSDESKRLMQNHKRSKFVFNNTQNRVFHGPMPEAFDAREHWPNCPSIREIFDQGRCGSCWAVATAMMMSDRACIATEGRHKPRFSAMNLAQCCADCQTGKAGDGCEGGDPRKAIYHLVTDGAVTGGPYKSKIGCQTYPVKPGILQTNKESGACAKECEESVMSYNGDLHYSTGGPNGDAAELISGQDEIMREIHERGPVVASLFIHSSMYVYAFTEYARTAVGKKPNIYYIKNPAGKVQEPDHVVRIIGWGADDVKGERIPYWLVANSWGTGFGDKGVFKIIRGAVEEGARIETEVLAGFYDEDRSAGRVQY